MPTNVGTILNRALWLTALAVGLGAAHSAMTPIVLRAGGGGEQRVQPQGGAAAGALDGVGTGLPEGTGGVGVAESAPGTVVDPTTLGFEVTLEQAYALFETGAADFIDARSPAEYDAGRILGAMNVPADGFTADRLNALIEIYGLDRPLIVYCGGGDCHASETVAALLQQAGFTSVHEMRAGFPGWQEAGYDVELEPGAGSNEASTPGDAGKGPK